MNSGLQLREKYALSAFERAYVQPSHSLISSMVRARTQCVLHELRNVSREHAILEVGCAFGGLLRAVFDAGYRSISGCDIDMDSLEKARTYVPEATLALCDAEQLIYEDRSRDVVICAGVLNYLKDPKRALLEMRRVLRKDGLIILSVGNAWSSARAIVYFSRFLRGQKMKQEGYRYCTPRKVAAMLHEAGFTADRIYYFLHALPFEYRWRPDSKMGKQIERLRKILLRVIGPWWGNEFVVTARREPPVDGAENPSH